MNRRVIAEIKTAVLELRMLARRRTLNNTVDGSNILSIFNYFDTITDGHYVSVRESYENFTTWYASSYIGTPPTMEQFIASGREYPHMRFYEEGNELYMLYP